LKRLKKSAPEVIRSLEASSSEAPHQKQDHQKAEVHQEMKNLKDSRAGNLI